MWVQCGLPDLLLRSEPTTHTKKTHTHTHNPHHKRFCRAVFGLELHEAPISLRRAFQSAILSVTFLNQRGRFRSQKAEW